MKQENRKLDVLYKGKVVGTLAMGEYHKIAFQYDDWWLKHGFSISPFSLPLKKNVFEPKKHDFGGLFGVFADSLPDQWGRLLLERFLKENGLDPTTLTVLDRLAIVGSSGMGALEYVPEKKIDYEQSNLDLDSLSLQCKKILNKEYSEQLDELYRLGGTSGGTRPKNMTTMNEEEWIIKFSSHVDRKDAGKMEQDYALCAKKCGIEMSETKLFASKVCKGYFGIKRFDRDHKEKIHMISAAALLEHDFRQPSLDYHDLMKLTKILTKDNQIDIENLFCRMCFNVFAHNCDDHSKNFSYLYDENSRQWRLSPAYDLTYSTTYYGEHTTMVNGNGKNPSKKDLLEVGLKAGMKKEMCLSMIDEVKQIVDSSLSEYLK